MYRIGKNRGGLVLSRRRVTRRAATLAILLCAAISGACADDVSSSSTGRPGQSGDGTGTSSGTGDRNGDATDERAGEGDSESDLSWSEERELVPHCDIDSEDCDDGEVCASGECVPFCESDCQGDSICIQGEDAALECADAWTCPGYQSISYSDEDRSCSMFWAACDGVERGLRCEETSKEGAVACTCFENGEASATFAWHVRICAFDMSSQFVINRGCGWRFPYDL